MVEVVLWIALFYIIVGVVYAVFHIELMGELRSALSGEFTIFADIAALAAMVAFWPFLWSLRWCAAWRGADCSSDEFLSRRRSVPA